MDNKLFLDVKNKLSKVETKFSDSGEFENNELFTPFNAFGIEFKNHFFIENLTDEEFCFKGEFNHERFLEFYEKLAKSNVGLICTGGELIENELHINQAVVHESKEDINKFSDFANKIHMHGAKIFLTIKSKMGRVDDENKFMKMFSYSSSFNTNYSDSRLKCVRLSDQKCNELAKTFANTARFAQLTNFDGVLIDGGFGGIVGEFNSNEFNKRTFGYYSNSLDLPIKILEEISNKTRNLPIIYKINLNSFVNLIFNANKKQIATIKNINKLTSFQERLKMMKKLVEKGLDGFIFEFGLQECEFLQNDNPFEAEFLFYDIYTEVKEWFKSEKIKNKFDEDVSLVYHDNINLVNNKKDLLVFNFLDVTKQIYANLNYLINQKAQNTSNLCIKCNKCVDLACKFSKIDCLINPLLKDSINYNLDLKSKKNIAVIGAGVSGLSCSLTLARRGYNVDLYDKDLKLNKNGRLQEVFGFDKNLKYFNDNLEKEINKFVKNGVINTIFNTKYRNNAENIKKYQTIVIATGFKEKFLSVSGAVQKHVKSIYDVLNNKKLLVSKNNLTLYVKSELGLKLALYLLVLNKNVNIVIKEPDFLFKMPNANLTYYLFALKKLKGKVYLMAQVKKIHEDSVELIINNKLLNKDITSIVMNMKSNMNYKYLAQSKIIDAELFIYEPEIVPNNKLYYELVKSKFPGELYMIGNALECAGMMEDIKSGFYVGNNI